MKLPVIALLVLGVSSSAFAQGSAAKDKDPKAAVQAAWDKVAEAFDKADAKAFAALWTEDGVLINPGGLNGKGRAAIEQVAAGDLATILKGGKNKLTVESVRVISPTAVWVDGSHDVTGIKAPDGKDGLHVHLVSLMIKKSGQWWFAEARPYVFLPAPPKK